MAVPITVPRLGWSMEEGTFVEWLKRDGDPIKPGDPIFVLESDKATENIEALDAGILRFTSDTPKPGTKVLVGQIIGQVAAVGEVLPADVAAPAKAAIETISTMPPAAGPAARRLARSQGVDLAAVAGSGPGGRITESDVAKQKLPAAETAPSGLAPRRQAISPRARRAAGELGIDFSRIAGTGRNGRIRERDIRGATPASSEGRLIAHTGVRGTIAARMVAGVTQAAPVTLNTLVDASNLVNIRNQFKAAAAGTDGLVPSYTDLVLKLTASALQRHPMLQAQWREEGLFVPARIDIGLAVDTDSGLLVPVLRGVDALTLRQVAIQTRDRIAQARAGKLTSEQMRDGTFTITSLGMYGVDAFTPILNLPQCAILGVGRIVRMPAVVGETIVPRDMLTLSLTFDHRVVDGAPAARFLDELRRGVEQPAPRLMT